MRRVLYAVALIAAAQCAPEAAAAGRPGAPLISGYPARARVGDLIEVAGENLGSATRPDDSGVLFFAGKGNALLRVAPESAAPRLLRVRVPHGALRGPLGVQTPGGTSTGRSEFLPEYLLHLPPDLFARDGVLGALQIDDCRIILVDGANGSVLLVSPAMAGLGFGDIRFTVPPLGYEVTIGPFVTSVRLRIPGQSPADPANTIQSLRVTTRIVGARIALTAIFEREGPEMVGEYFARDSRTGTDGWVHALDVEADDLTLTVSFPIQAQGASLVLGKPSVAADFSFVVSTRSWSASALNDTFTKDALRETLERAVANALDLEAYRTPLAAAISTWLREGALAGLPVREIRPIPATDGGLDLQAVMLGDP